MKMPWSFLRRRRTADPAPDEIAEVKEAFDTDQESADPVHQQSVAVPSPVAPADASANLEEASGKLVPAASGREEVEHSVAQTAEVHRPQPATKSSSRRNRPAGREQRGKIAAPPRESLVSLPGADTQKAQSPVSESTPNDAFVLDAAILDGEIRGLRRELAEKLKLQNAQLKEMLQRFDPS